MNQELFARFWLLYMSGGNSRWKSFIHNGVMFPDPYIKKNIPIQYKNQDIILNELSEEYAFLFAKYKDTAYGQDKIFRKNFFNDWNKILKKEGHTIDNLDSCNFDKMYEYLILNKKKKDSNLYEDKFKIAIVDGVEQPVGNFRIEPPGIFIGRGCNPKLGKIKRRIYPEDITLNLSKDAPIPVLPEFYKNRKWGSIINEPENAWIASWKDEITGKTKYVWLSSVSDLMGQSDKEKYEKSRKLSKIINKIIETNNKNLESSDIKLKQIATATYLIMNFALRVGNEKGEDEADTVGTTSLRVEHITIKLENKIKLDFLGKDSIRFTKILDVSPEVYDNMILFTQNKKKSDELFDKIYSNDINKYLQTFMEGLTAKVFRTYNASMVFEQEIKKIKPNNNKDILIAEYNKANAAVAALCNHQKGIVKENNKQIDNIKQKIGELKEKIKKLKESDKKDKKEKIEKMKEKLKLLEIKLELRKELVNISLGTSKMNYIDPRITVAFVKKYDIPIEKVFTKSLKEKFKWALDVDVNFTYNINY